jgi:NAD(P)-dependent dehydrogenase (short-subunit alcohol dehydrogenase family)
MADVFATFAPQLKHPVRGMVACAGVSDNGPATDFPIESFRRLLDINVTGTFAVAQLVAQQVQKSGVSASMVLVASMSGYVSNKVAKSLFAVASSLKLMLIVRGWTRLDITHPKPQSSN